MTDKLSEFPLERAGLGDAPDDTVIVAWPGWNLTVGDVRAAKLARDSQAVAVAGSMPGTEAWTVAVFPAADAPIGTRVYAHRGE